MVKDIISKLENTQKQEVNIIKEKGEEAEAEEEKVKSTKKEMIHSEKNKFWNTTLTNTKRTIEMSEIGESGVENFQFFDSPEES